MFTRVVNLLTFKGLLSRVRRGKGKRRDQPRPQNPKPHQTIRTYRNLCGAYAELSAAIKKLKFFSGHQPRRKMAGPAPLISPIQISPIITQNEVESGIFRVFRVFRGFTFNHSGTISDRFSECHPCKSSTYVKSVPRPVRAVRLAAASRSANNSPQSTEP